VRVERPVEVGDEARLREVELHLAEEFRPHRAPELVSGDTGGLLLGVALRRSRALRLPRRGERVVGVVAVLVRLPERDDQAVADALGDVRGAKSPKRWDSAPVAFRVPARPSPPSMYAFTPSMPRTVCQKNAGMMMPSDSS
jgi:hypothetical protein